MWWKLLKEYHFENHRIRNFANCTTWPQNQTQGIRHQKYTQYMCNVVPQVPNFCPFRSAIGHFQDFPIDFRGLPIDSHVKISNCHNIFKFWQIAKISITVYFPMTALLIIKFGSNQMKTVGGVAFWNFQPHMVLCSQKFQSAIKFLNFCKLPNKATVWIPSWRSNILTISLVEIEWKLWE